MPIKTMDDVFVETLKDIYYAEKHILKALPGMVKKAGAPELKKALETHHKETEGQIGRLEEVFKLVDTPARGKKCDAIEGILAEAKEQMEEIEDKYVLDAGMIGSAQAVEHYEITRYGTLIAWAKQLGHAGREPQTGKACRRTADANREKLGQPEGGSLKNMRAPRRRAGWLHVAGARAVLPSATGLICHGSYGKGPTVWTYPVWWTG
jgi:ferritin-like metal-binding protein YciE